jgi:hypothetical protein
MFDFIHLFPGKNRFLLKVQKFGKIRIHDLMKPKRKSNQLNTMKLYTKFDASHSNNFLCTN